MPIYVYKGIDNTGREIKDSINTDSIIMAKQKVKALGIMIIDIHEKKSKSEKQSSTFSSLFKSVSVEDIAIMTRQLSTLIKAKIQIVEALGALEDQVENDHLRIVLSEVKQDVNEGSALAQAMGKHPKVFSKIYVNMVEAGEASGTLEVVLIRLADFTESQMKLKNKIRSAMMYPMVIFIFAAVMMNIIFIFIIPKIAKIFLSRKMELPFATKLSIAISNFLQNYWWATILAAILLAYLFLKYINTPKGQRNWHKITLKLPIFGDLIQMINVSRFCSTLSTLMQSGVPILTSLTIVRNLISNVWMQDAIEKAREAVSEGASMAPPLKNSGYYPGLVIHMVTLGEKTGELESMLNIISENYEDRVESKIAGLTSILEPVMMIGMGAAVGFIVMSVVVPMMNMSSISG